MPVFVYKIAWSIKMTQLVRLCGTQHPHTLVELKFMQLILAGVSQVAKW